MSLREDYNLKRSAFAIIFTTVTVGSLVALIVALPADVLAFWFGETVNHCPESEFACPSTSPGAAYPFVAIAIILLILNDVNEDDTQ